MWLSVTLTIRVTQSKWRSGWKNSTSRHPTTVNCSAHAPKLINLSITCKKDHLLCLTRCHEEAIKQLKTCSVAVCTWEESRCCSGPANSRPRSVRNAVVVPYKRLMPTNLNELKQQSGPNFLHNNVRLIENRYLHLLWLKWIPFHTIFCTLFLSLLNKERLYSSNFLTIWSR